MKRYNLVAGALVEAPDGQYIDAATLLAGMSSVLTDAFVDRCIQIAEAIANVPAHQRVDWRVQAGEVESFHFIEEATPEAYDVACVETAALRDYLVLLSPLTMAPIIELIASLLQCRREAVNAALFPGAVHA